MSHTLMVFFSFFFFRSFAMTSTGTVGLLEADTRYNTIKSIFPILQFSFPFLFPSSPSSPF